MRFDVDRLSQLLEATGMVDFGFLLGSAQNGEVREGSDLDVAVMYSLGVKVDFDAMACIYRIVDQVAPGVECDLIRLNAASESIRFEALKGQLLFVKNGCMERYMQFYSITCREYEDYRAWSARQLKYREIKL